MNRRLAGVFHSFRTGPGVEQLLTSEGVRDERGFGTETKPRYRKLIHKVSD